MTAFLTRRFILTSLVLVLIAGAAAFAIGHQETPARAWVAGQAVPCAGTGSCDDHTATHLGAN